MVGIHSASDDEDCDGANDCDNDADDACVSDCEETDDWDNDDPPDGDIDDDADRDTSDKHPVKKNATAIKTERLSPLKLFFIVFLHRLLINIINYRKMKVHDFGIIFYPCNHMIIQKDTPVSLMHSSGYIFPRRFHCVGSRFRYPVKW